MHNRENGWSVISLSITSNSAEQPSHIQLSPISLRPWWGACLMWPISYFKSQMQTTGRCITARKNIVASIPTHTFLAWESLTHPILCVWGNEGFHITDHRLGTAWRSLYLAEQTRRHMVVVQGCSVAQMQHEGCSVKDRWHHKRQGSHQPRPLLGSSTVLGCTACICSSSQWYHMSTKH